ncbi:MAG: hypothetical protein U1E49_09970 [Hyphomicrobiaceae bacterium]
MTPLRLANIREAGLELCIKLELALIRIGIASVPIDVLLNCDDVVYAALALHS